MSILIDENTTFIIQGITGREAVTMTREVLDYGSKVLGGVTPRSQGPQRPRLPVEDTVRAFDGASADASVKLCPAFATDAVFEAVEAGIKLVIIVTERIPRSRRPVRRVRDQHGARIIGPNCLGAIPPGKARGRRAAPPNRRAAFKPGVVGVMSRSGG
ncbi:MAG: hypothetical protein U0360_06975 [Dehalococcoidia bacterium]